MGLIKLNLYSLRSQNCSMEILSAPSTLIFNFKSTFRNHLSGRIDTYFESCGIQRALRNSSQSKKLKANLPMGQLVSHTSKKATKANRRKEFSCSCRELSWKARGKHIIGVDAIVFSTNTHSKVKYDHRSKFSNLSNWKEEAWKKSGLQRDLNPWPPRYRCDALPTELWSHTLGARSIYWAHFFPCSVIMWNI